MFFRSVRSINVEVSKGRNFPGETIEDTVQLLTYPNLQIQATQRLAARRCCRPPLRVGAAAIAAGEGQRRRGENAVSFSYPYWGIENGLHWVLDVSFDEDACRIRKDRGAQTFSVLRHIALNLLRRESQHKRGIKARRKRAGWDRDYLLQVLTG
jgi:hypothetical protein